MAVHRGGEAGRQGGERRGVFLSSDIVIKESPLLDWARLLAYSHPVWLPDTLAFTHTLLSARPKEERTDGEKTKRKSGRRREAARDRRWDGKCEGQLLQRDIEEYEEREREDRSKNCSLR